MPDASDLHTIDRPAGAATRGLAASQSAPPEGLTSAEVAERRARFGRNALQEQKVSPLVKFLGYFWGPIPWMIEVAAVLSAAARSWDDFVIILALLVFNAAIGFWQEHKAANALEALKRQLALKARVLRDGQWRQIDAAELVPDDVIRLRLGDVIPADVRLLEGDYLSVDQSALTGESLPVTKQTGDTVYSSAIAKQGEMLAVVTATGGATYFGRTARLVARARPRSHFQKAVLSIGDYLIYLSLGLVVLLVLVQLHRGTSWLQLVQFALILTVASIPVAMPAVLSVTMAVGALALSKRKAVVSRLESIEEMAGADFLCSDKTGTLTQNKLTLGEPAVFGARGAQELIVAAALASKAEDGDAIDLAILGGVDDRRALEAYRQTHFTPFDPVSKRTEARIESSQGGWFRVTKGAPQVVLGLVAADPATAERAGKLVAELAAKGYRTLGVARADGDDPWRFLGLLSLFDPPREDSKDTVALARAHGLVVKMVTGDNVAIAREIAGQLGLGTHIVPADALFREGDPERPSAELGARIEAADGFAQVFPEHKYGIVKALQARGHLVAMTGDGVNDAPALKQADVGIAVSGATDAARAAADLILMAPGLSVIISAIEEARRIFERMNAYAVYRITETIRIMIFVVAAMIVYGFYPITAIMVILLAFLNDVPIMTIAYDNTRLDPQPVRWDMHRVLLAATVMGLIGVAGSFVMLYLALHWLQLSVPQVQTYVFLKMAVAGHLTLFVARARGAYLARPFPAPVMIWSAVATKLAATMIARYGLGLIAPITWPEIGLIWAYAIVWSFLTDLGKIAVYRHLDHSVARHTRFLATLQAKLAPAGANGGRRS